MRSPLAHNLRVLSVACAALAAATQQSRADDFQVSYAAGSHDEAGHFLGGTEMRLLVAHGGRLYGGNGYWEDRPGAEGPQGAQILVLDSPGGGWRVGYALGESLTRGQLRGLGAG